MSRQSRYVWPASSITAADMALLFQAREASHRRVAITELIATAVRHTYGQINVLNLPANPIPQDKRKAA